MPATWWARPATNTALSTWTVTPLGDRRVEPVANSTSLEEWGPMQTAKARPTRSRPSRSASARVVRAETTGCATPVPCFAEPPQLVDQGGVGVQRRRVVQQPAQCLVVVGRTDSQLTADRLLLGAGVLPPATLEGEDLEVTSGQGTQVRLRHRPGLGYVLLRVRLHAVLRTRQPADPPKRPAPDMTMSPISSGQRHHNP